MAPKVKLTAALFHERYGNLVSENFAQYTTAHTLRVALSQRSPPIIVTDGMLKIWFAGLPWDASLRVDLVHSWCRAGWTSVYWFLTGTFRSRPR